MAELLVRQARPEDKGAIADITHRGWEGVTIGEAMEKRHGQLGPKTWREWKREEVVSDFERRPECFVVAELNGRVVGYASYWYDERRRIGHVGNNGVAPDFRGRGIGTALIAAVLDRLRELG
ncbi:MAG: GNAT family N-acetyltransferase, partial [Armatimonadetes bacterium]|nr:GNAT family N-acetyltransferase [Armatimonadota bacterium]